MILYSREQNSFEEFCRAEFTQLFQETTNSVTSGLSLIESLQEPVAPTIGATSATKKNSQFESIEYSYFSGGKRFRPLLTFAGAEYLDLPIEMIFPWAMAIEMVHTYSLIHDDLPCMDNDDIRRGLPTNHKVYGEAIALLAGDSLITESFAVLGRHYANTSALPLLIQQLAHVSGVNGMILGQYYDMTMESDPKFSSQAHLNQIHLLKTGALISGALIGPALLKGVSKDDCVEMKNVGSFLGYAFQVKDDILDSEQDKNSKKNLIYHFGSKDKLTRFLEQIHAEIEIRIQQLSQKLNIPENKNQILTQFLQWNIRRDK